MNGHLGCFHILPIMYNTTINGRVDNSSRYWFHFHGWYTQKWDCRVMITLFVFFLRKLHTVFHNDYTIYSPTRSVQGFPSHSHQHLYCLFDSNHPNRGVLLSHCGFDLHFWWLVMLSTCSFTYWLFVCLLWKKSVQFLCPFLIDTFGFLLVV